MAEGAQKIIRIEDWKKIQKKLLQAPQGKTFARSQGVLSSSPTGAYSPLAAFETQMANNQIQVKLSSELDANLFINDYSIYEERKTATPKEENNMTPQDEKYIDQRFLNVEEKLNHKTELLAQKIDNLSSSIKDNTYWMKTLVENTHDEIKEIKNDGKDTRNKIEIDGKTTRATMRNSVIALFLGLGAIVVAVIAMQDSWLREYINILAKVFGVDAGA